MGQLRVSGQIVQSPSCVQEAPSYACAGIPVPAGVTSIPLSLTPTTKPSVKHAGGNKALSSPSSFQAIGGLGATDDVTMADTVYIKSDAPVQIQLTQQNLAGGSAVVSVVNLGGSGLWEFPVGGYLTGLAAQGTCNLEYLISGPA